MQKIKTDEIAITNSIKEKDQQTIDAFKMMAICLKVYDEVYNTNHFKNVKKLYLERNAENLIKISNGLYTDDRSLTRYRKKYLLCFNSCSKILKKLSGFFSFLNKIT